MTPRFLIVQHAEKTSEPGDPGLSARGGEQANAAAEQLAGIRVVAVYASPLRRAQHTAAVIADRLGLQVSTDGRLTERMNWDGESQSLQEFLVEWQKATEDRNFEPSSGESSRAAGERLGAALADLACRHPGHTVVVVGHGGITMDLARHLLGDQAVQEMAPGAIDAGIPNGAITEILSEEGGLSLVSVASTTWAP